MAKSLGSQALDELPKQHGTEPSEPMAKIRTPEQLALLEAAMMEELGIGRKDTLPLEDRGYNDTALNLHSLKKTTKRLSPYDPVTRWHNVQFDDVDPAMNELDSIADGQLYRLRRAAARGGIHQLPDHSGGGRGGLSNRGRYLKSGIGQGTNMSPRAGHASGVGRGFMGRTSDLASTYLGHRPPPPYSGSRRESKQSRIEMTIACLRGDARLYPESSKADYIQPTSQESHGGQTSRPAKSPAPPAPESFLSSPEAFLAKVGFNRNSQMPKQSYTSALDQNSSSNVAPKSISKPATSPGGAAAQGASSSVYVQKPQPVGPLGGVPVINISTSDLSIVPLSKMALAPSNPDIGFAGSRWATPGSTTPAAPTTKAAPRNPADTPLAAAVTAPAPIPMIMTTPSNAVVTASATPLTATSAAPQEAPSANIVAPSMSWDSVLALTAVGEAGFSLLAQCNTVKIVQNGGANKDGALRIIKYYGHENSIIQVKVDGVLCVDEQLVNCAISEVTGPTIIFRTAHGSPQITFPSPYEANHFEETWLTGPKAYMEKSTEKELLAQSIPGREAKTIIQISNSDTTVHLPSENGLIVYNHDLTSDNLRQLDDVSRELPDNQNVGQLLDLNAPVQYRASDRMNNDTLHDLSTLEGGQLLISLDDDDDEENVEAHENVSSALEDLLDLDNEPLLEGALNYLDHGSAGSFLQKLSRLVSTAPTNSPAVMIDQILATLPAVTVAESLVGEFFRRSEIFNMLTLGSAANVIKRKTKKILEIAVSQRDKSQLEGSNKLRAGSDLNRVVPGVGLNQVTTWSIANQACGIVEGTPSLTTGPSLPISYFSTIPRQIYGDSNPSQSNTFVHPVSTTKGKSSRITYTAQELLQLRAMDSTLDFEKVAKNSSAWKKHNYLVRPSHTVAVTQGAAKLTNVSKPAMTAESNASKISTAMVGSEKLLPEVSMLPAVTSSGSNPKESNLPVFQAVQQAPRPSVHGVVQQTASLLSVVQQNERLVPATVQGKSSLPSAIRQNRGAVPAVIQDKPTVFPVIQQNDRPSVLASVQSNSSQLLATQKIQGPVSTTVHQKTSVAPAVPKNDRPMPPSVFENPSTTPPAQQIELHVAATVQQNTSTAPVSQQKQLVNATFQLKASQLPAVQQKESLVIDIVQERSSLAQMELQKAVKTDHHSSSPGTSNLVGTTGLGRQGPDNSRVAPPAIAQNTGDDRAPQTGRAADNSASHQAKISRLSTSAKEFNQVSHKENSSHEQPSINRHRPTRSEWEIITTEFGALSLRPENTPQRVRSSAPRHGEESRTALSHLSTQPLSALPIPSNVTIQGAGLAASRWAMASHSPTLSPAFPHSTLTPNQGYAPLIQTVLIPHPVTGEMQEFTGMVKAGSIHVAAHVPIPRFIDGSQLKENIPMCDLHSSITTPRGFSTTQPPSFNQSNSIAPPRPEASFRPNAPAFQPMGQINFQQYTSHSSSPPPAPRHRASPPTGRLFVPSTEDIPATPWFRNMTQSDSESPGSFHL